jgi:cytochrome c
MTVVDPNQLGKTARSSEFAASGQLSELPITPLMQIKRGPLCRTIKTCPAGSGRAMLRFVLRQTLVTLMLLTPALAASPAEQRGKTFALTNCARCHSIDRVTQSPLKIAPPFRSLHNRYPVETLAEALAEGINTGHPTMPEFQLLYMKSLE